MTPPGIPRGARSRSYGGEAIFHKKMSLVLPYAGFSADTGSSHMNRYLSERHHPAITAPVSMLDPEPNGGTHDETEQILFALALAVEQRDSVTAGHCERLALTSVALGAKLSLDRRSLLTLYRAGYLHD